MAGKHDTAVLDAIPRKTLSMGSEAIRKPLADEEIRRAIGRAIERAVAMAGLTKQQAAAEMGYGENQAPLSRWISGTETPQFSKLWSVPQLRSCIVIALAQLADDIEVTTNIRIRKAG